MAVSQRGAREAVSALVRTTGYPVLVEATSQLRLGADLAERLGVGPFPCVEPDEYGMTEPAAVVERLMVRYPSLYADTSYREMDILKGNGEIDEQWRKVLERFADRFMVGSDTWVNTQWLDYDELIATNRLWLAYLTTATAKKIAYQNAERLFGKKIDSDLFGNR